MASTRLVEVTFTYTQGNEQYTVTVYPQLPNWERAAAGKVEFQYSILNYLVQAELAAKYPDQAEAKVFSDLTWDDFAITPGPTYARRPRPATSTTAASSRRLLTVAIQSSGAEPWSPSRYGTENGVDKCTCTDDDKSTCKDLHDKWR